MGKVTTEDCVKRIGEILSLIPEYVPFATEKWKRLEKGTVGLNIVRTFGAKGAPITVSLWENDNCGIYRCELLKGDVSVGEFSCKIDSDVLSWLKYQTDQKNMNKVAATAQTSGPYKFFHISTGYVEAASIGSITIAHKLGFQTPEEGLQNFVDCTKEVIKAHGKFDDPNLSDVEDYLNGLYGLTNDSWGYDDWENYQGMNWEVPAFFTPQMGVTSKIVFVSSFLWHSDHGGPESSHFGEWTIGTFGWDSPKTFTSKASQEADKEIFGEEDEEDGKDWSEVNPSDYIFTIGFSDFGFWQAYITPQAYLAQHGYMYDQHLGFEIPGWGCEMEGVYSHETITDPQKMYENLVSLGFSPSVELGDLIKANVSKVFQAK